jgi:excisionase family DNA binding protein
MNEEILKLLREPTISVDNAARVLKIGRNAAYEAVRRGEIESIPIGKRRIVPTAPLRKKLGIEAVPA